LDELPENAHWIIPKDSYKNATKSGLGVGNCV
jgi:hypothetical protein